MSPILETVSEFATEPPVVAMAGFIPAMAAYAGMPAAGFAPAQATEGEPIFATKCALCHGDTLQGGDHGPALKGTGFWTVWQGQPARKLYSRIISTMPYNDPGTLTESETLAVTALIARSNGAAEGPSHTAASELDAIALAPAP